MFEVVKYNYNVSNNNGVTNISLSQANLTEKYFTINFSRAKS